MEKQDVTDVLEQMIESIEQITHHSTVLVASDKFLKTLTEKDVEENKDLIAQLFIKMALMSDILRKL